MMTYQNEPLYQEETLLEPSETQIRFEAILQDADYLLKPNSNNEFVSTYIPLTMNDHQLFMEVGEKSLMLVDMLKSSYSRKVATKQYETRKGLIVASQLFPPKLNIDVEYPDYLPNRKVSVSGHFRDLDNGSVLFNIDYLDFYEEDRRTQFQIEEEENPDSPFDIDF
ncbi:hypothetical protein KR49_06865 [Synechococcus sp. KORDI-49]|nr:hypothetical protein KR49_06865 [Synechococcus sp. KORDI-49]